MGRDKGKGPMGENVFRLLDVKLRMNVRQVPSTLDRANHLIVVIDENEDPNVIKDGQGCVAQVES